ncbi:MAG: hypothetical protein IJW81_08855, partial [Clostridia bacterium]|nr:hypothetical protein [Clostridia bacterium]
MSKLTIGFGRADITPPNGLFISGYYSERRGQGCLDDLKASVLAFSDGEKTAVVFTLDVIGIDEEFGDRLRGIVAERTAATRAQHQIPITAVCRTGQHTDDAIIDHVL